MGLLGVGSFFCDCLHFIFFSGCNERINNPVSTTPNVCPQEIEAALHPSYGRNYCRKQNQALVHSLVA